MILALLAIVVLLVGVRHRNVQRAGAPEGAVRQRLVRH